MCLWLCFCLAQHSAGAFLRLFTSCRASVLQGNVYVKCPSIAAAIAAVNALHGRWFAGECRACRAPRSLLGAELAKC